MLYMLLLVVTGAALSLFAQIITNLVRLALQRALGATTCPPILRYAAQILQETLSAKG